MIKQNLEFVLDKQTENYNVNIIAGYYKVSLAITLIDIVLSELKKRFEGNKLLFLVICISFLV